MSETPEASAVQDASGPRVTRASGDDGARRRLVIVESPAKAKTIKGYLGPGYTVEASVGHIRDLPTRAADIPAALRLPAVLLPAVRLCAGTPLTF